MAAPHNGGATPQNRTASPPDPSPTPRTASTASSAPTASATEAGTPSAGDGATPVHDGQGDRQHRGWEELAVAEDAAAWRARTRVVLTPMAAPSIMGLFGFTLATLMVGAWQATWYGGTASPAILWPFALFAGGVFQLIAAVASLRARDGVAVAFHSTWGAFWIAWGIMQALAFAGVGPLVPVRLGVASPSLAFWFIGLTVVTVSAMLASLARNLMLFVALGILSAASALTAAGLYAGSSGVLQVGGWFFVGSATAAWIVGTAMLLEHAFGRTIIPLGTYRRAQNIPGRQGTVPLEWTSGMPGVRAGQQ